LGSLPWLFAPNVKRLTTPTLQPSDLSLKILYSFLTSRSFQALNLSIPVTSSAMRSVKYGVLRSSPTPHPTCRFSVSFDLHSVIILTIIRYLSAVSWLYEIHVFSILGCRMLASVLNETVTSLICASFHRNVTLGKSKLGVEILMIPTKTGLYGRQNALASWEKCKNETRVSDYG
jgi:hypothetical protein